MYAIAVDIGGTFTDVVAIDGASGQAAIGKVLTTPDDLPDGVLTCLEDAAGDVWHHSWQGGGDCGALVDAQVALDGAPWPFLRIDRTPG